MNKDFENKLHAMNDQDLAAVSGGTGNGVPASPYSVGQRIRVLLKTELGEMVLIGTITDTQYIGRYVYADAVWLVARLFWVSTSHAVLPHA